MEPTRNRDDRRFGRQLAYLERRLPKLATGLTQPGYRLVRLPVAAGLIAGSTLSVLPLFGVWMLPLGLVLLAVDLPALRPRVSATMIRARRWVRRWRARR